MGAPVRLEINRGIAAITFCRPESMNVLDVATGIAFERAVLKALADAETRVVLLRGEGRSFMAGGDIAALDKASDRPAEAQRIIRPVHRALKALAAAPSITIAAAQGPVTGAGMSIFLGADLAIATENAVFNMAYARVAVSPDCGGTWALPRIVGLRRAMAMALLCQTVTASDALDLGLVNTVVANDALDLEAMKLASRLAAGPAQAQASTKTLLRDVFNHDYPQQLDAEEAGFLTCAAHGDFSEGLSAFFEKRQPDYL